ncbi:hypothetical protein D047_0402A, partial [Vibrio parahaemolyticus VPTS-2010_2]
MPKYNKIAPKLTGIPFLRSST